MKKDIHDDHLDDYVRNSFDDYEEDPQDLMWNRIENALEQPEQPRRPLLFWANRWSIAASFVIFSLLAGLAYSHFYYEAKIQALSNTQLSKGAPPQITTGGAYETEQSLAAVVPQTAIISERMLENTIQPTISPVVKKAEKVVFEPRKRQNLPIGVSSNRIKHNNEQGIAVSSVLVIEKATIPMEQVAQTSLAQSQTAKPITALEQLPVLALTTLPTEVPKTTMNSVNIPVIQPHKTPSGWYVGVQATRFSLRERGVSDDDSDNTGIGHHPVSHQQKVISRSEFGLEVGKKYTRNFGVETGVSYRSFTRLGAHTPRFRFRDGILHPHNPGSNRNFDFSYNLDTYSGETAVTVRMEEVDNNTPALPDEPLTLKIITSEQMKVVRVPVLFTAQQQFGPVALVAKTGLVGNMIIGSQLDITSRITGPGRFQPAAGTGAYSLKQATSNRFFLGYQCNAGVEVKLGQHLAATLDMGISGDFDRKKQGGQQLPGLFTTGITAGLSYYF